MMYTDRYALTYAFLVALYGCAGNGDRRERTLQRLVERVTWLMVERRGGCA